MVTAKHICLRKPWKKQSKLKVFTDVCIQRVRDSASEAITRWYVAEVKSVRCFGHTCYENSAIRCSKLLDGKACDASCDWRTSSGCTRDGIRYSAHGAYTARCRCNDRYLWQIPWRNPQVRHCLVPWGLASTVVRFTSAAGWAERTLRTMVSAQPSYNRHVLRTPAIEQNRMPRLRRSARHSPTRRAREKAFTRISWMAR